MRVISGNAKGRPLRAVPGTGTRPTTDKVKEAVFSMIGPYFDGGDALDLFAGTGALGIEAVSRGMSRAVFIDADRKAIETIRHNVQTARMEEHAEIFRTDAMQALKAMAKRSRAFDFIFLDPPYRMKQVPDLLLYMEEHGVAREGATVVVEHDAAHRYPERIGSFVMRRHAEYGETGISIYGFETEKEMEL